MMAKLVRAGMDPGRVDEAAAAVEDELIPEFAQHPGARSGYWMCDRATGHVVAMTCWADDAMLHAEQAVDGMERSRSAEHVGLRVHAVHPMEVVAMHEVDPSDHAATHWVRVTWVEAVSSQTVDGLAELHDQKVAHQSWSDGFRASYWLADRETGDGVAFSMWSTPGRLSDSEPDSRRRRRSFERETGSRIVKVATYESVGIVLPRELDQGVGELVLGAAHAC